jgi:nitrogen fixation NifU-like protein
MELNSLYTELILEHNSDKRNKRLLEAFTNEERGHNPSCGDEITIQAEVVDGYLKDLGYTGHGCAISQASASMMIDLLKGKKVEEALETIEVFLGMIKREISDLDYLEETLEDAFALQNISNMPARVKCAVLAWHTLKEAVNK